VHVITAASRSGSHKQVMSSQKEHSHSQHTVVSSSITVECHSTTWLEIDGATVAQVSARPRSENARRIPRLTIIIACGVTEADKQSRRASPQAPIDIISATSTYASSLSSTALSSTISRALSKLCAPKATGTLISCSGKTSIPGIEYPVFQWI